MGGKVEDHDALKDLVSAYVEKTGGLISALRAIQARYGFLPSGTEGVAAEAFNLSRAEVKGVISFYSDFSAAPKRGALVRLCAAEACQAQGGRDLEHELCRRFAVSAGESSASGDVTLERVYCLGLCSAGPAASVDDRLIARATPEKVGAAVARSERARK